MIGEAFYIAFGPWLFSTITSLVIGFCIGRFVDSWAWRLVAWFGFVVAVFGFLSTSETFDVYDQMWRSGLLSAADLDTLLIFLIVIMVAVYMLGELVGKMLRKSNQKEQAQRIRSISTEDMIELIEIVTSNPTIAVMPWTTDRWNKFSSDKKISWVNANATEIRTFMLNCGSVEEIRYDDMIMELQRIDRKARRPLHAGA